MTRVPSANYTDTDENFDVLTPNGGVFGAIQNYDVGRMSKALENQDHSDEHGLPVKRINYGLFASRPAAGNAGHIYFATDTGNLSVDTGAAWIDAMTAAIINAAGDLLYGSAADTVARLALGTYPGFLGINSGATAPEWNSLAHTAYVATLTQGVSVAATLNKARYLVIGKHVWGSVSFTPTASGTAGSAIEVGAIPAAIAPRDHNTTPKYGGVGKFILNVGGNWLEGTVVNYSATVFRFMQDNAGSGWVGTTPSIQIVSGSELSFSFDYEIA